MNRLQIIINQVLNEMMTNTAGGLAGSSLGVFASSPFSGDNYAPGDSRVPKLIGSIAKRSFPELVTSKRRRKKKIKHKRKHKHKKRKTNK